MNYDLFLPPAVVESAAMSAVSSGRVLPGQLNLIASPHRSDAPLFGERASDRRSRRPALMRPSLESARPSGLRQPPKPLPRGPPYLAPFGVWRGACSSRLMSA